MYRRAVFEVRARCKDKDKWAESEGDRVRRSGYARGRNSVRCRCTMHVKVENGKKASAFTHRLALGSAARRHARQARARSRAPRRRRLCVRSLLGARMRAHAFHRTALNRTNVRLPRARPLTHAGAMPPKGCNSQIIEVRVLERAASLTPARRCADVVHELGRCAALTRAARVSNARTQAACGMATCPSTRSAMPTCVVVAIDRLTRACSRRATTATAPCPRLRQCPPCRLRPSPPRPRRCLRPTAPCSTASLKSATARPRAPTTRAPTAQRAKLTRRACRSTKKCTPKTA